jgi:ribosome-associated protein
VAQAALNKLAEDVLVLDLRQLSNVADFFILATVATLRQAGAITELVDVELKRQGQRVWHTEGLKAPNSRRRARRAAAEEPEVGEPLSWVVMDCGQLVLHLFTPAARQFYQLERLWGDAPHIPLDASA